MTGLVDARSMRRAVRALHLCLTIGVMTLTAGCKSAAPVEGDPWAADYAPPLVMETGRVRLEPLTPHHAELDHAAFMSSREHLQRTLRWGSWPSADMTVEQNRTDLQRHLDEFNAREAYAYTVLRPDGQACVGCIYINPVEGEPRAAAMAYWVVAFGLQTDLDAHLLEAVLEWIEHDWPLDSVTIQLHTANTRGIEIAEDLDLDEVEATREDHVAYVWRR